MQKEEYDDPLDYIQIKLLGHCGCGRPQDSLLFLKKLLNHMNITIRREDYGSYEEYSKASDENMAILDSYFYNDDGLKYTIFYMLDKYGITEHGGSVPGWLESKGDILLEELNKIDFDNIED